MTPPKNPTSVRLRAPQLVRNVKIDDFRSIELFKGVCDEALQLLAKDKDTKICKLKANQRLHPTRESVDYIYIVLTGYVAIWRPSCFNPREKYFLAWRGPNQIIGEMRKIYLEPTAARFITCDPCTFLQIRNDTFLDVAKSDAAIYRNMSNLLLMKMKYQGHRCEVIQNSGVTRKVAQTIMHLAEDRCGLELLQNQDQISIPGKVHQKELGAYAGVDRATVNRELRILKEKEVIDYHADKTGSQITITDRQGLERIVRTPARRRRNKVSRS